MRLARVITDLSTDCGDPRNLEIRMSEKIRHASMRDVLAIQCGQEVHAEDFELVCQLFEDVIRHSVASTIGIAQTLNL